MVKTVFLTLMLLIYGGFAGGCINILVNVHKFHPLQLIVWAALIVFLGACGLIISLFIKKV